MKLISCEITAFGKLSDYKYDFCDGLNAILEDNGWGKTTFCVFIKSMFYGLEYNQKHSLNERKHYKPWEGSSYGGSLTFEVEGKRYRIERSFKDKDKDDTFALYNADTGLVSDDYSADIGEELFGVDRESFERSIFIPQEVLETSMTDSLNAKMGNLSTVQDDINQFDKAIERVVDKYRTYTSKGSRNTGSIPKIREQIRQQTQKLEKLPSLRSGYDAAKELLAEKHREHKDLLDQKNRLKEEITSQSKREQKMGAYSEKKQMLEKYRTEESALSDFFANGIPESSDLAQIEEKDREKKLTAERIHEIKTRLPRESEVERLRALFEGHEVDEDTLEAWKNDAEEIRKLKEYCSLHRMQPQNEESLKELKAYFSSKEPVESEINQADENALKLLQLDAQIETLEDRYSEAKTAEREGLIGRRLMSPFNWMSLLIALVLLAGGFMHYMLYRNTRGLFFSFASIVVGGLLLVLVMILVAKNRHDNKIERRRLIENTRKAEDELNEKNRQRRQTMDQIKEFLKGYLVTPTDSYAAMVAEIKSKSELYHRLLDAESEYLTETKASMDRLSDLSVQFHTSLSYFVDAYGNYSYEDIDETEVLVRLSNDVEAYGQIKNNLALIDREEIRLKELGEDTTAFVSRFPIEDEEQSELAEKLAVIRHKADRYAVLEKEISLIEEDIAAFEKDTDIDESVESVEELQSRQLAMDERLAELGQQIVKSQDQLLELSDEIESLEEIEEGIEDLKQKEQELCAEAELIEKTGTYLRQARERFLSKYMGPLRMGLKKYLLTIVPKDRVDDFELDMNLDVKYVRKGSTWASEYLSAGYQDLVSLCARMALIDVLYTGECPPVVLDDPFTNLDEEKIKNATGLVEKLAGDRQIIYLTCHESRMIG